jgi:D-serine deaminase-like pyridoxal phosphate-dependent protein
MCYPGQVVQSSEAQADPLAQVAARLEEAIDLWRRAGLPVEIVSGGSTPSAFQSHLVPQYTEIRPGTYIFNDTNTVRGGYCGWEDCAARIVATVVSDAVPNQVVLDAGSKTLTSDLCGWARESGHGFIVEYPDARISKLSEEHGQVDVSRCDRRPALGERVTIVPNHICPCVNLQDVVWWTENGGPLQPLPVDARGRVV